MNKEQLAEQLQKECHEMVTEAMKRTKQPFVTAQDGYNAFFYMKLAELQLQIAALEKQVSFLDSENSLNRPLI